MAHRDFRNLPGPVRERLAEVLDDREGAIYRHNFDVVQRGRLLEARDAKVEVRSAEDGSPILDGYATVFEFPYAVCGGPPFGWTETVAEGAATKSLRERDPVVLLFDHEGIPFAATDRGTPLVLDQDSVGLHFSTPQGVNTARSDIADAVLAMRDGLLDACSMAFRVLRQEWNGDYTERRILELQLFDVSVVASPANPATVVQLRKTDPTPAVDLAFVRAVAASLRG